MTVFKCKMCGGTIEFEEGATVGVCDSCGTKQTLPKFDSEKKMQLFERANRLRLNCEFDKAASIYENIISEFPKEAEGYWGNLLCNYGIEYVDDPATGNKVPTCHRSSFTCFLDEEDFEQVMENADAISRSVYREQAKQIEEIRKGIVEVSGREQPYDIFICYKETADDGQRTIDSVIAQDVYDALAEKGYRVFFSRISLEDKLGTEYEPYIFAALNSARLMLAFGTSYDYYNAVWVKNEWGRFLKLMASDKSKHLIPCFKDVDAYDIPKEFRSLQAQDMGKVGAVQDLLRGIDKLMGRTEKAPETQAQTVVQQVVQGGPNVDALLKRGYDSLEDGAFDEAEAFFNDALNSNAESADAYLGLFMAEIKAPDRQVAQKKYVAGDYTDNRYWKRATQYAAGELADSLREWDDERNRRLEREEEAERMAKEEADRKAREKAEAEKKKQEELKRLLEQLQSGKFDMTEEEQTEQERLNAAAREAETTAQAAESNCASSAEFQEVDRLEKLVKSKETQLAGLGLFKGKEKKELQTEIGILEKQLAEARKKTAGKQDEINGLKKAADDAMSIAGNYVNIRKIVKERITRKKIAEIMGLDFSGDVVTFGAYEQGKGKAPIEWRVLERSDKGILLLSRYALDCQQYNTSYKAITWEECTLRKWLNGTFLNDAFSPEEQALIKTTTVNAEKNPKYGTNPGKNTHDRVFLLSIAEAVGYFSSAEARECEASAYAKSQGAYTIDSDGNCWWWLRSPGSDSHYAADVDADGGIRCNGDSVYNDINAVRPALWINLES